MRLLISKENFLESEMDVCHVTPSNFTNHCFIPFIVTSEWDECIVDVTDDMSTGYIPQVLKGVKVIAKINEEEISNRQLTILSEIYPDVSNKLRLAFRRDRGQIPKILEGRLYEQ